MAQLICASALWSLAGDHSCVEAFRFPHIDRSPDAAFCGSRAFAFRAYCKRQDLSRKGFMMVSYSHTSTSPVVVWTEMEIELTKPKTAANRSTPVIILLKEGYRAVDVLHEAAKPEASHNPFVRTVIDNNLGYIELIKSRPADAFEERLLRVIPTMTDNSRWANNAIRIGMAPGVKSAADTIARLNP